MKTATVMASDETTAAPTSEVTSTTEAATAARSTTLIASEVIGESVQGRDIVAMRVGMGEKRVLVIGGFHGDEYGTDVAEQLLDALGEDAADLPADVELHVISCLNPDGFAANTRGNANGVDLNLNLPSENWVRELHPNTRAYQSGLNGGSSPGSEPETKALIRYLERRFRLVISLHSSGGIIDWDGEGGESIARNMSRISGLPAQHLAVQPYATGTLGIYVPEVWSIPVITIELSSRDLNQLLLDAILYSVTEIE